ncbi:MAG: hypothetical protein ABSA02_24385 [Trebonia sp.]|jgi:hypothetical protein
MSLYCAAQMTVEIDDTSAHNNRDEMYAHIGSICAADSLNELNKTDTHSGGYPRAARHRFPSRKASYRVRMLRSSLERFDLVVRAYGGQFLQVVNVNEPSSEFTVALLEVQVADAALVPEVIQASDPRGRTSS